MKTAKALDCIQIREVQELADKVTCLITDCPDYDAFRMMPNGVTFNDKILGLIGWNPDRREAYYRSDKPVCKPLAPKPLKIVVQVIGGCVDAVTCDGVAGNYVVLDDDQVAVDDERVADLANDAGTSERYYVGPVLPAHSDPDWVNRVFRISNSFGVTE